MRFEWKADTPPEYRAAVEPLLKLWVWLLPNWLDVVFIEYEHKSGSAGTITRDRYRNATLFLRPALLEEGDYEREVSLVHELCHFCQGPIQSVLERFLEEAPDDKFKADTAEHAMEQVVSDLSHALVRHRRKAAH